MMSEDAANLRFASAPGGGEKPDWGSYNRLKLEPQEGFEPPAV